MEQQSGSKLGKEYVKAVYCHPAYLTSMQSTSCEMLDLDEAQAGTNIAKRNITNLRYAHDPTLMAESEEELKSLLMKVKEESEKVDLKYNIQKTKIMASGPITLWQIEGETMETVTDFIFGVSKITADGDCSHEIKRCLLLLRSYDQPRQLIKKQRHYFPTKAYIVKVKVKVTQSCMTLCNPMVYRVHGFLQAKILEWVAFPSPRDLSNPGIKPRSPT